MPMIKQPKPKLPKQRQPKEPSGEDLINSDPPLAIKDDPKALVLYENEEAKRHPHKHDPNAKTITVRASGVVVYNY